MKLSWVGYLVILATFSTVAQGIQVSCSLPQYENTPDFGTDKNFRIPVYSDCVISGANKEGLKSLNKFLRVNMPSSTTVETGPDNETFEGLPGVKFTLSDTTDDGRGNTLVIRSDLHIATDLVGKLVEKSVSTHVQGTGDSGYLRRFNVSIVVETGDAPGTYKVHYGHTVAIAKPWFAPTGIFKNQAVKGVTDDFVKSRDWRLKEISEQL